MAAAANWSSEVEVFERAGRRARRVLEQPAVEQHWDESSMLPRLRVGGLGVHLLGVLRTLERRLDGQGPPAVEIVEDMEVVDPALRYGIVRLARIEDLDLPQFANVREQAHRSAGRGHAAVTEAYAAALTRVTQLLVEADPERPVSTPAAGAASTLRDYTLTRTVELVVHADDLAESVHVSVEPPDQVMTDLVAEFLFRSVRHRLGDSELLRALAGRRPTDVLRAL